MSVVFQFPPTDQLILISFRLVGARNVVILITQVDSARPPIEN